MDSRLYGNDDRVFQTACLALQRPQPAYFFKRPSEMLFSDKLHTE